MPSWNEVLNGRHKIGRHEIYTWYKDNLPAAKEYRGSRSIKNALKLLGKLVPDEHGEHKLDKVEYHTSGDIRSAAQGPEPHNVKSLGTQLMEAIQAAADVSEALYPTQRAAPVRSPELSADRQLSSKYFTTDFLEKHAVYYSGPLRDAKMEIVKKARQKSRERLEHGEITRSTVAALTETQKQQLEAELEKLQKVFEDNHEGANALDPMKAVYVTKKKYSFMSFEGINDPLLNNSGFEPSAHNEYLVFGVRKELVGEVEYYRISHLEKTCRNQDEILKDYTPADEHPEAFVAQEQ